MDPQSSLIQKVSVLVYKIKTAVPVKLPVNSIINLHIYQNWAGGQQTVHNDAGLYISYKCNAQMLNRMYHWTKLKSVLLNWYTQLLVDTNAVWLCAC